MTFCGHAGWVRTDMTRGKGTQLPHAGVNVALCNFAMPRALDEACLETCSSDKCKLAAGLIDVDQSVKGLLSVLESDLPLNGQFYDYKHEAIPW